MLKEKRVKSKGITLISLVVTIIILIILAGVSLNIILGENGIVKKSKIASESYNKEAATEAMNLKITNVQISKYAEVQRMPTLKELADNFSQDEDFEYVQETSEVASSSKIISENPTSIYTKLKAYDYEFEINSSLQLASINGVKVSNNNSSETVSRDEYNALLERLSALESTNSNTNPTGTVITYIAGSQAPSGYLACDGTIYNISEYPVLAETIKTGLGSYNYYGGDGETTFAVPDLRGEFLRGTGTNSHENQGNGAKVGKHQDATEHATVQGNKTTTFNMYFSGSSIVRSKVDSETGGTATSRNYYSIGGTATNGLYSPSYTSRPTNTSVLYCIKY